MKRILIVPLILILCFSIFVGCNNSASSNNESNSGDTNTITQCEHDDLERISNLNESTARYKCKSCGEIQLTTDPDSLPKTYQFSGAISVTIDGNTSEMQVCTNDDLLSILNGGLWETSPSAYVNKYDYSLTVNDIQLLYDSENGVFLHVDNRFLTLKADERRFVNDLLINLFIRQSIPDLNMATLISLVEIYGENVTWDTFAPYYYEEIGSGMYILLYPIVDANYYLLIGGSSPYTSPMYIRLVPTDYPDHSIDIRTESITDFLNIEYSGRDFEPGVILLGLNEAYQGDIRELFPQLEITEVEDIYLKLYEKIVNQPGMDEQIENIRGKIGTEFIIKLTDTTKKAVGIGIASIEGNPLIAYAMPNYVVEPAE